MQTKPKKYSIIRNVENFKKEKSKMRNLQLINKIKMYNNLVIFIINELHNV